MRKCQKITIIAVLFIGFLNCQNKQKYNDKIFSDELRVRENHAAQLEFEESNVHFPVLKEGEKISHTYIFKNIGNIPLKIHNVVPSCGCTASEWTKELVYPDEKGQISITFDSKNKKGKQSKTISIIANTKEPTIISFDVEVQ